MKLRNVSLKKIEAFCNKYVATYTPGYKDEITGLIVKSMPTKGVFHIQLLNALNIRSTTIRKWKQLEDKRYEPIEEVYEFIKARVEDAILNGEDRLSREFADKYYGRVFHTINEERGAKDASTPINIVISGTDPFEDIQDEDSSEDKE